MPSRVLTVATAALAFGLACSAPALAARTDVVVLKNGDHLTCEVLQMRQGKLQIKTDDAGSVSIEWDKIASLTTADAYDLSKRDGSLLLGRFAPGAAGALQIVAADGTATTVAIADIAAFARIKTGFVQRINGSFDLGGNYTKSSGVANVYFNTDATYRRPAYAYSVSFSTNFTRQPDTVDTSRYSLTTGYTRYRGSNWIVSAFGLFEGNRDLGIDFRGTAAGSIGRYLARANHAEFLLTGGFAAGRELPVDSPHVTNIDALIGTNLSVFTYDYPTTSLGVNMLVFPSLDDPGRVRVNAEAKLKREVFKDFFISFSGYDTFDSRPKSTAGKQNDVGGSLSFGWTF